MPAGPVTAPDHGAQRLVSVCDPIPGAFAERPYMVASWLFHITMTLTIHRTPHTRRKLPSATRAALPDHTADSPLRRP